MQLCKQSLGSLPVAPAWFARWEKSDGHNSGHNEVVPYSTISVVEVYSLRSTPTHRPNVIIGTDCLSSARKRAFNRGAGLARDAVASAHYHEKRTDSDGKA